MGSCNTELLNQQRANQSHSSLQKDEIQILLFRKIQKFVFRVKEVTQANYYYVTLF